MGNIFEAYVGDLPGPQMERTKRHKLLDIVAIGICGVRCGADNWVAIEQFGLAREAWLKEFLELANGIPSHATFGRVFGRFDAEAFGECFMDWVRAVYGLSAGQVLVIDGKTMRGSADKTNGKAAMHVVFAWASTNQMVLGQVAVADKSNEITAIPELLGLLVVQGCQRKIAQAIRDVKGDYVLRVKAKQGHLYRDLENWFVYAQQTGLAGMTHSHERMVGKDHGRRENREDDARYRQDTTVKVGITAKRLRAALDPDYLPHWLNQ